MIAPASEKPDPRPTKQTGLFEALSSLRLTVVLFALAIFLVLAGTLAQVDHDIWYVVDHTYFRVWFAWIEFQALWRFVELFVKPEETRQIAGGFWFPGGMLIGAAMGVNLLAAHAMRFKVAVSGDRLLRGIGLILIGAIATTAVVVNDMDNASASRLTPEFCSGLWQTLRGAVAGVGLAGAYALASSRDRLRPPEWWVAATLVGVMLATAGWLFVNPSVRIDDAGMRILWQLAKGGAAGGLLLWGCAIVFRRRAGVVLLHAGVLLLMAGELITALAADEAQMRIEEGQTVNYAYDIRETELAVVTPQQDGSERVTVVPDTLLARAARSGEKITSDQLPFDLRVLRHDINAALADAAGVAANPATEGIGLRRVAQPLNSVVGVGQNSGVNLPSAYVELLEKPSGESLGVWLLPAELPPQEVTAGGETRLLAMRFERDYKPYSITLLDFSFDRYVGTNKPKNYSSDVVLRDPSRGVEREVRVWMNNPLRYAGDTLYQSGFDEATEQATVLQVATNGGWMIPYVSCMLVGIGMLAHFGATLMRFTRRRSDEAARRMEPRPAAGRASFDWRQASVWAPVLAGVVAAGYLASKARPPAAEPGAMAIERFGALPIVEGGRVKPIDTYARNTLQFLSSRQEVRGSEGEAPLSATEWLLESIASRPGWRDHRVIRIENLELLDLLGLERRVGSYRYSYDEVTASQDELSDQVGRALERQKKGEKLTIVQTKTLELSSRLTEFRKLVAAFGSPRLGADPATIEREVFEARSKSKVLSDSGAPRAVPPGAGREEWITLYEAELNDLFHRATGQPTNPSTVAWSAAIGAYEQQDADKFSQAVEGIESAAERYQETLNADRSAEGLAFAERLDAAKVRFEHWYSRFSPFYYCAVMYLLAFVLTALGWLGWPRPLGRSATAVIAVTLLVHTFALVARIYISGRPPVTNLYSSAVFIGWGAALFGLALEAIYKMGVGNAVASAIGFATLLVAHFLSLDGDTFTVLQAVLDTQFWLATHVVCITLGYATTFLAGFLGVAYLIAAQGLRAVPTQGRQQLSRMTYGVLCFALFFSFIGTVLGGLWADDSWGRFWGWDPKENGALIIVLWNALVLHARWGKLVGPVGLATLAVGGNLVTAWSWFGVNELGVGLHSYGFTDGVSYWLLLFGASQLAVMALALLPSKAAPSVVPAR